MCKDGARRTVARFGAHRRLLLIDIDGAMLPAVYQQQVGETAGPVLQRQPPIARQAPGADRQGFL
jgi:diaminopropionate ammonia-lyase